MPSSSDAKPQDEAIHPLPDAWRSFRGAPDLGGTGALPPGPMEARATLGGCHCGTQATGPSGEKDSREAAPPAALLALVAQVGPFRARVLNEG
jgi:hypothetical protein